MGEGELKARLDAVEREIAVIRERVNAVYALVRTYGMIIVLSACFGNRAIELVTNWMGGSHADAEHYEHPKRPAE